MKIVLVNPPHNLAELSGAICFLIDKYPKLDDVTVDDLMEFVQGPDFPTGGSILGREGILSAYATGKGKVTVRYDGVRCGVVAVEAGLR